MPTKKPDPMLTAKEVAEQLGVTYLKVLNLINAGEFPNAINTGGEGNGRRYGIPQSDVHNWRESRKVVAA